MQLHSPYSRRLAGFSISVLVRNWMSTLDYQCAYYDSSIDPVRHEFYGRAIYLFWHEYISFPFYLRGHCNFAMLLSRHRDADWLAEAARYMGFESIRGSTFRGGSSALRELSRKSESMNLAITPDGPRGPRRCLAQGPIYLSSKLGLPLVMMGFGYDRPWRLRTWDRHGVPRPFSRARAVVSPRVQIPPDLDRAGVEHYRCRIEGLLNRLTCEAETWAEAGTGKRNQVPVRKQAAPLHRFPPLAIRHIEQTDGVELPVLRKAG